MSGIDGAQSVRDAFGNLQSRQIPFALSLGINRTLNDIRDAERNRIGAAFANPSAFTRSAVRVRYTKRTDLDGRVFVADDARGIYLLPQEVGGPRRRKPFEIILIKAGVMRQTERAIPASGRVTRAMLRQIISQVSAMQQEAMPQGAKGAKARRRSGAFFVPRDPAPGKTGMPRGIWRRQSGRNEPIIWFTENIPTYRPRFQFRQTGLSAAKSKISSHMRDAARQAMLTARPV